MNLLHKLNRRRRINKAVRELMELNDETLRDIGIERGDIHDLVVKMIDAANGQDANARTGKAHPIHVTSGAPA